jgi:RNA polymerase sigma factor (sigma-70 family)
MSSESLALLCQTHRPLVFQTCRQILGNDEDAADATQEVFERVTRYLLGRTVDKPAAYLTQVAKNTAYEALKRKLKTLESTPLPDNVQEAASPDEVQEWNAVQSVKQLAEQMKPFLTSAQYKRLLLRIELGVGHISLEQVAAALKIKQSSLRATDPQLTKVLTEAAVTARMFADPRRCDFLARLVHDDSPSRALGKKIDAHVQTCKTCQDRQSVEKRRIYEAFYTVPGLVAVPAQHSGAAMVVVKKSFIAAAVGAAACLTFAVVNSGPFSSELPSEYAAPPPVVTVVPPGPVASASSMTQTSSSAAPPSTARVASPERAAPATRQVTRDNPPVVTVSSTTPDAAPRDDMPPSVLAASESIEHRRITPAGQPGCDQPTTSDIRVLVTGSPQTVRMTSQLNGKTETRDMRNVNGTPAWVATVGPYPADASPGAIKVAVVATDQEGRRGQRDIGVVNLGPCGR